MTPDGTSILVEARAGNDPLNMDCWTAAAADGGLADLAAATRYLQYRLVLSSTAPAVSPIVYSVGFNWTDTSPEPRHPEGRAGPP